MAIDLVKEISLDTTFNLWPRQEIISTVIRQVTGYVIIGIKYMTSLFQDIYFEFRTSSQSTNKATLVSVLYALGHVPEIAKSGLLLHKKSLIFFSYSGTI